MLTIRGAASGVQCDGLTMRDFIRVGALCVMGMSIDDLLQIDAFASHGSSGSPVVDGHGHVIGVVFGAPKESGGRIVYAVPAERITEFLNERKASGK